MVDATKEPTPGDTDPVQWYTQVAMLPGRKAHQHDLKDLRKKALAELRLRHGRFLPIDDETLGDVRERLSRVADPVHLLVITSAMAGGAWPFSKVISRLRADRNRGILSLYHSHGWPPSRIAREVDLHEAKDARFVSTTLENTSRASTPEGMREEEALDLARAAHEEIVAREALAPWAMGVRDRLLSELGDGRWGRQHEDGTWDYTVQVPDGRWEAGERGRIISSAALARLAGLSTAAVSTYQKRPHPEVA